MKENKLTDLLNELFSKRISKASSNIGNYDTDAIDKEARVIIEQIIRKHLLDDHDEKLGILESKIFVYEEIISKSNFAPMIKKETDSTHELKPLD